MKFFYNQIAGQNKERLAALSDGIFAVPMTLLLLELRVPARLPSEAQLRQALAPISWQLLAYRMSFITVGIFWVGQQTQLTHLARSDRDHTWIHLAFLFAVTLMPFAMHLRNEYSRYRTALLC